MRAARRKFKNDNEYREAIDWLNGKSLTCFMFSSPFDFTGLFHCSSTCKEIFPGIMSKKHNKVFECPCISLNKYYIRRVIKRMVEKYDKTK